MFRLIFGSKTSLELSIQHSRSLSRYSESYLHVHDSTPTSTGASYNSLSMCSCCTSSVNYCTIFIVVLLIFSDNLMITSSIPLFYHFYQPEYGPIGISSLYSLYGLWLMITQPFTSYIIDRKGPKIPLMYGIVSIIFAVLFFLLAFNFQGDKNQSYGLVILGQCCHGIASPLIQQGGVSLLTMSHPYDTRNRIIYILTTISLIGYIFGPLYSALLYYHINSLSVYILPAIFISIAFLSYCPVYNGGHSILINEMTDEDAEIAIGLMPSHHMTLSPTHSSTSRQSIASSFYGKQRIDNFYSFIHIFTNKFHFITFIASLLSTFLLGIFYPLGPNYLDERFNFNIFQQGLMITLLLLCISLLSPLLSYFIDKTPTSTLNTYSHLSIHSTNQLTSLTQYQAIYIGLLIIGLSLCCIVWIINIYILILVWLAIGIGFAILTIPLMRFFGEIAEVNLMIRHTALDNNIS